MTDEEIMQNRSEIISIQSELIGELKERIVISDKIVANQNIQIDLMYFIISGLANNPSEETIKNAKNMLANRTEEPDNGNPNTDSDEKEGT